MKGFDEPQSNVVWEPDAWMLLGVKVVANDADDEVWFVRLSTLEDSKSRQGVSVRKFKLPFGIGPLSPGMSFTSPVGRVLVEIYDQQGTLLRSSVRLVPLGFPNASILDSCTRSDFQESTTVEGQPQVNRQSIASLMATLQTLGTARALFPIRASVRDHDIFKKPSVLSVLLAGLQVHLQAHIVESEMVKSPWSLEAALIPRQEAQFPVSIAGQKVFDCRVVVGPPNPPYNLLGGVLLFEAVHPENTAKRLTIRVLAAKRMGKDEGNQQDRAPAAVTKNAPSERDQSAVTSTF
ncbi:MAG: hypothetical protein L0Y42_16545 [Phycisphaerales bacterium]|nr:hypothetical protein [Phycisphaerales bacterium]